MNKNRSTILICIALAVLTLGAFWRVLGCGFIDFDDELYVTSNKWVQAGPTLSSIKWALTASVASNWHPLTLISHMSDCRIFGMNPMGHHLVNVILHVLSTVLLFLLIRRMTGFVWRGAFIAALFAVHPLHVESVAWVAERKDVLSALLWILTMHAYVSYVGRPNRIGYVLALGLFALGLMAKPMLVSLPFVLLLVDYWPLGRFQQVSVRKLVGEKIPFFVLAGASSVVTYVFQLRGESVAPGDGVSIGVRLANALVSYVAYLVKMVWPAKLAVLYPHPLGTIPTWQVVGSALLIVAISIVVLRAARTRPYLAVGWLWYVVTLIPVVGLVQVGAQAMADRYTYVPLIGIFVALTWGIAECGRVGEWARGGVGECENGRPAARESSDRPLPHSPTLPLPLALLPALVIIAACAIGTWHQTGYWKDSVTLFQRAVGVTQRNHVMETNLGLALNKQGNYDDAIPHFQASVRITPTAKANSGIGVALLRSNRPAEAVPYLEKSLELEPTSAETHSNLGFAFLTVGNPDRAIAQFTESLRLKSDESAPHFGLGLAYSQQGKVRDAEREYHRVLSIDPNNAPANNELAVLAFGQGKTDEAVGYLEAVIRVSPDAEAHYRLGSILTQQKRYDDAIEHFQSAIRIKPDHVLAHYDLGVALSVRGRMDEAIEQYSEAAKIAPDYARAHVNLAIALYSEGDYAGSWREVSEARRLGVKPDPKFLKALSAKMPPGRE